MFRWFGATPSYTDTAILRDMCDSCLLIFQEREHGWIKYIFPYGRISDLTQFDQVQRVGCQITSILLSSHECFLALDLHCCQILNFPCFTFCTFSFAKPIQKIELRSNFHQDKFCAKEASLGSLNAIVHIFKITKTLNFRGQACFCVCRLILNLATARRKRCRRSWHYIIIIIIIRPF